MSNRTDFDRIAAELVEMFKLDPTASNGLPHPGSRLLARLETELHDAFVAGEEQAEREIAKLRAALKEALDWWSRWDNGELLGASMDDGETARRIAELRKLLTQ
jgi:hypothetical protein